ncbi:Gfo/Idh/MocA family protein [Verrucomicrobiota bacterium]
MNAVRLALVGCGSRGIEVGANFKKHPDCELTAVMDIYPSCTDRAVARLGVPGVRVFDDFNALLEDGEVDAILVACDPTFQIDLACRAMEAGKHVCTEVPAAFSIEECRRLVETVERTGYQYQLMEQVRYWGFVETWAEMRRQGEFGHVCFAQGEYIHYERGWGAWINADTGAVCTAFDLPSDWKAEPTWRYRVLSDPIYYLPHTLSPLLKILDDRVVRVSCMGTRKGSYSFPDDDVALPWSDIQYALMHTARDTVLCVGAGFSLPYVHRGPQIGCHWYEVRGTTASVESPRCKDDSFRVWRPGMGSYEAMDVSTIPINADDEGARSGHGGADTQASDRFIKAVQTGVPSEMDVYRAVETAAPAILAAESARKNGQMLEVPDFARHG